MADVVDLLRAILNYSDGLQAAGRLKEGVAVAFDGIEQARRLGLTRFYGPFLAGNATLSPVLTWRAAIPHYSL